MLTPYFSRSSLVYPSTRETLEFDVRAAALEGGGDLCAGDVVRVIRVVEHGSESGDVGSIEPDHAMRNSSDCVAVRLTPSRIEERSIAGKFIGSIAQDTGDTGLAVNSALAQWHVKISLAVSHALRP